MIPELKTIRVSEVVFDEEIYPRREHDLALVRRYADSIEEIDAAQNHIAVSADMKLLDGKHRWLAYRKRADGEDREIQALVYPVTAPHDQLKLAAKLNSEHGWQLTEEDKKRAAQSLFTYGLSYDEIAKTLSVGKAKVVTWLSDIARQRKETRNRKICDLWLACHTQEEISAAVNTPLQTVNRVIRDFSQTVPWYQMGKLDVEIDDESLRCVVCWLREPTESLWLDVLLQVYTDEASDIVVDPFAGSGATIDACRRQHRRCFASDIKPAIEREHEIHRHDPAGGLPSLRWKDVKLVYLNPPDGWCEPSLVHRFARKLRAGRYIALVVDQRRWGETSVDFVFDTLRAVELTCDAVIFVDHDLRDFYSDEEFMDAFTNGRILDAKALRFIVVWSV